jgi:S-adenosylmethionine decarboxylase
MQSEVKHKNLPPHIFSLRFWLNNTDPSFLRESFNNLLSKSGYNVLDFSEYFFPVQGYTAIWLLAESHLAVHTFPQNNWSYIELSGCNRIKTDNFKSNMEMTKFEVRWETENPNQSFPHKSLTL